MRSQFCWASVPPSLLHFGLPPTSNGLRLSPVICEVPLSPASSAGALEGEEGSVLEFQRLRAAAEE